MLMIWFLGFLFSQQKTQLLPFVDGKQAVPIDTLQAQWQCENRLRVILAGNQGVKVGHIHFKCSYCRLRSPGTPFLGKSPESPGYFGRSFQRLPISLLGLVFKSAPWGWRHLHPIPSQCSQSPHWYRRLFLLATLKIPRVNQASWFFKSEWKWSRSVMSNFLRPHGL